MINRKLPKELLLRAFSFLDVVSLCRLVEEEMRDFQIYFEGQNIEISFCRCAQVSKTWNLLALDGSNWQQVDLFKFQVDIEGTVVENLAKRCGGFLKTLSLNGCQVSLDHCFVEATWLSRTTDLATKLCNTVLDLF